MDRYYLSRHTFVQFTEQHVVFLEARSGEYFALSRPDAAGLSKLVHCWPTFASTTNTGRSEHSEDSELAERLSRLRILTTNPKYGKAPQSMRIDRIQAVVEVPLETENRSKRSALRTLSAYTKSVALVKALPLRHIVDRLRCRKESAMKARKPDPREVAELLAVCELARRSLHLPTSNVFLRCLMQLEFLAYYDVYPQFTLAFRMKPFDKHCWLQYDGTVFSEDIHVLRSYFPILAA